MTRSDDERDRFVRRVAARDPWRIFTLVVSALFVAIGIWFVATGTTFGWSLMGFFGLCLVIAIVDPWLTAWQLRPEYRLVMTGDEVACEDRRRRRQAIRWEDVQRVWYVTTSAGPHSPDEWIVLEGEHGGCSFPTEASGFDGFYDAVTQWFPGFDYAPMIHGGTTDARHLCWERK